MFRALLGLRTAVFPQAVSRSAMSGQRQTILSNIRSGGSSGSGGIPRNGSSRRNYSGGPFGGYSGRSSARSEMFAIIGLNTAVFAAWSYARGQQNRDLWIWLTRNFTLTASDISQQRWHTLLTSAISHNNFPHFLFNMISFHAFGSILSAVGIGGVRLFTLCTGSALAGSLAFIYNQSGRNTQSRGLGASGMVMGAAAAAACLMPFAPMQLFFIPVSIPLWAVALLYTAVDSYYVNSNSPIGHAAHLGGSVFGLAYYGLALRRFGGISRLLSGRRL